MIYDKNGYVLFEAILFLWIITFFMALIFSLVQAYPDEDNIYQNMLENDTLEELYHE